MNIHRFSEISYYLWIIYSKSQCTKRFKGRRNGFLNFHAEFSPYQNQIITVVRTQVLNFPISKNSRLSWKNPHSFFDKISLDLSTTNHVCKKNAFQLLAWSSLGYLLVVHWENWNQWFSIVYFELWRVQWIHE